MAPLGRVDTNCLLTLCSPHQVKRLHISEGKTFTLSYNSFVGQPQIELHVHLVWLVWDPSLSPVFPSKYWNEECGRKHSHRFLVENIVVWFGIFKNTFKKLCHGWVRCLFLAFHLQRWVRCPSRRHRLPVGEAQDVGEAGGQSLVNRRGMRPWHPSRPGNINVSSETIKGVPEFFKNLKNPWGSDCPWFSLKSGCLLI